MDSSGTERSAAYYDGQALRYDADVTAKASDRLARAAFQDLVARYVASGSTILDFGCGTGLDACQYAQQGYRVLAYDNSPGMVRQLEARAASEIAAGRITTSAARFQSFPAVLEQWPRPDAIVADFAVINMIDDPAELFGAFAERLASPGWLIFSVLNPWHWSRLATPGWWPGVLRSSPQRLSADSPTFLHFPSTLLRGAQRFHIVGRAFAGRFVRYDARSNDVRRLWWGDVQSLADSAARLAWRTPIAAALGSFCIFVMRRDR